MLQKYRSKIVNQLNPVKQLLRIAKCWKDWIFKGSARFNVQIDIYLIEHALFWEEISAVVFHPYTSLA